MDVKVKKLHADAKLPVYVHEGDAGMDLFAAKTVIINPGERTIVPAGFSIAIPTGYVGLVWDKSGRATKDGLTTMAGVIDSGYRGEMAVVLLNTTEKSVTVHSGEKIAQMLIQPVAQPKLVETNKLDDTTRGADGFGSTGLH